MYVCVCVCVCAYVCLYVCVRSCVLMGVCVCAYMTCIYAAFTHVRTDVYYMCTIHVRPYTYMEYDDYVLGPCRAANVGGSGSQGCALAAASSSLRRLHALQQSRVTHARRKCLACSRTFWGKPSFAGQPSERASRGPTISSRSPCSMGRGEEVAMSSTLRRL